ncbi:hypothetical protein STXM2123_456 [Streptomyces sp. F-3]|nr:hypothetical protein STXM2123_456 [Streptomyces sp. F-3]
MPQSERAVPAPFPGEVRPRVAGQQVCRRAAQHLSGGPAQQSACALVPLHEDTAIIDDGPCRDGIVERVHRAHRRHSHSLLPRRTPARPRREPRRGRPPLEKQTAGATVVVVFRACGGGAGEGETERRAGERQGKGQGRGRKEEHDGGERKREEKGAAESEEGDEEARGREGKEEAKRNKRTRRQEDREAQRGRGTERYRETRRDEEEKRQRGTRGRSGEPRTRGPPPSCGPPRAGPARGCVVCAAVRPPRRRRGRLRQPELLAHGADFRRRGRFRRSDGVASRAADEAAGGGSAGRVRMPSPRWPGGPRTMLRYRCLTAVTCGYLRAST